MGLTVTQLSFDFGGSNPSLPTNHAFFRVVLLFFNLIHTHNIILFLYFCNLIHFAHE